MTKVEMVEFISGYAYISKKGAERALHATIDSIIAGLKKGEDVDIAGFGKFHVAKRAARAGRNPRTGESLQIKASKTVRMRMSKAFKESVNVKDKEK